MALRRLHNTSRHARSLFSDGLCHWSISLFGAHQRPRNLPPSQALSICPRNRSSTRLRCYKLWGRVGLGARACFFCVALCVVPPALTSADLQIMLFMFCFFDFLPCRNAFLSGPMGALAVQIGVSLTLFRSRPHRRTRILAKPANQSDIADYISPNFRRRISLLNCLFVAFRGCGHRRVCSITNEAGLPPKGKKRLAKTKAHNRSNFRLIVPLRPSRRLYQTRTTVGAVQS